MNESLYLKHLERAARKLEALPRSDGGWGLTPTSVSSIVNTAEVAVVLRAAGRSGPIAKRAIEYLSVAIPTYCQPEPTYPGQNFGRGERTRFVSFGLEGLSTYPDYAFELGAKAIDFSLNFLRETQLDGGWPETRNGTPDSIHQTARVVGSLVRLILADDTSGRLGATNRAIAERLAVAGGRRLVELQLPDGSWPVRPTSLELPSPTKTALATMALGYLAHVVNDPELDHVRQDGGRWLVENIKTWDGKTEEDTDEQGTHWVHLAYAECVRGVLAGFPQRPRQLKSVFDRLARSWSSEESLWTEPGKPEGKATIRAAYHTVMAYESARPDTSLVVPRPLPRPEEPIMGTLQSIKIEGSRVTLVGSKGHGTFNLAESPMSTLVALHQYGGRATTEHLAEATNKSPASIHQNVKLINQRAAVASYEGVPQLLQTRRRGREYYYELAGPVGED